MNLLSLTRIHYKEAGIFGSLTGPGLDLFTLEHAYGTPQDSWAPKVPPGRYTCVRGIHRLEGHLNSFETFEICGVEGHSNILFHVGNYNQDSEGCCLLGKVLLINNTPPMIGGSKEAFNEFMKAMNGQEEFILVVT